MCGMKGEIRYQFFLASVFAIVWIAAAINPLDRTGWLLENIVVFIFVPIGILLGRYFKISDASWTCVTLFMLLHVAGSHWTYAYVPFGDTLADIFGASRNMYDRLVHFSFGLLFAYPLHEMFQSVVQSRGKWAYLLPLENVLAISALYEIFEWFTAIGLDAERAVSFLGSQGDFWDTQKDMTCAALGAIITLGIVFLVRWLRERGAATMLRDGTRF